MQLKHCLILFVGSVSLTLVASCGSAPQVNYCIPGSPQYGCANGALDKEKAVGLVCFSTIDNSSVLKACKLGIGAPNDVTACLVLEGGDEVVCSDGKTLPAYDGAQRFACMTNGDLDRLLIWCKRKQQK